MNARRAEIELYYSGTNVSEQVKQYLESISYTDVASGSSDTLSVVLDNTDERWMGGWIPVKGDRMKAGIHGIHWETEEVTEKLNCGEFEIDSLSFGGTPNRCTIGAVSIPQSEEFNSRKRTKTWQGITLREIAEEISGKAGVDLYYEADEVCIESIEQNSQEDCKFLYSLCQNYGLAMKVYSWKIVIFEEERYERRPVAVTFEKEEVAPGWNYRTEVAGTYTGACISFTDPDNDEDYIVRIGGGSRILELNITADNLADAERKGIAQLNDANKKMTTMSITVKFNPKVTAGSCIQLNGFARLSGKYYVEKAVTKASGSGETSMSLSLRLVVDRIKSVSVQAVETAQEQEQKAGTDYTVVSGDTLWDIARRFLGSGVRYVEVYNGNMEVIESTAKGRGKKNSGNGHWIFPGTVLRIPPN